MINSNKSIIDNWSIEQAAGLMYYDIDFYEKNSHDFFSNIGGLSNFINSMLLYKQPHFLLTGNEFTWKRFTKFATLIDKHITPIEPLEKNYEFHTYLTNFDKGANYYLSIAKYYDAELFLCSDRSTSIIKSGVQENNNELINIFNRIDKIIYDKTELLDSSRIRFGIQDNFILPSLTHYVLSETSSQNDLLDVILELKRSNKILKINEQITELYSSVKSYTKFQKELNNILKKEFNEDYKSENNLNIGIKALFFSISKNFDFDFINNKTYITYLKDIVSCRTETYGLKKHVDRVFKTNI
jgi:hypothetical protein